MKSYNTSLQHKAKSTIVIIISISNKKTINNRYVSALDVVFFQKFEQSRNRLFMQT